MFYLLTSVYIDTAINSVDDVELYLSRLIFWQISHFPSALFAFHHTLGAS